MSRYRDWSYLGFTLAQFGIPTDVIEDMSGDYEPDPWRPPPNTEIVWIAMSMNDASRLNEFLEAQQDQAIEEVYGP